MLYDGYVILKRYIYRIQIYMILDYLQFQVYISEYLIFPGAAQ
jgi:hypothetical protein